MKLSFNEIALQFKILYPSGILISSRHHRLKHDGRGFASRKNYDSININFWEKRELIQNFLTHIDEFIQNPSVKYFRQ